MLETYLVKGAITTTKLKRQLRKANANASLVASTRSLFGNWDAQIYVEHRFRDRQTAAALYFAERHSASVWKIFSKIMRQGKFSRTGRRSCQ